MEDRLITPSILSEDFEVDAGLRPKSLQEYIGTICIKRKK